MRNLLDLFVTKRCHLVVEEQDVVKTLRVINQNHRTVPDMAVGNCGWDDTNKWFIHFTTTKAKWKIIRKELNVVRVFENTDIPANKVGVVYSTD